MSEKMGCMPLEYEDFRHVVHHYDEPKFRLELAVPEVIILLILELYFSGRSELVDAVA